MALAAPGPENRRFGLVLGLEPVWTRLLARSPRDPAVLRAAGSFYFSRATTLGVPPINRIANYEQASALWSAEGDVIGGGESVWRDLAHTNRYLSATFASLPPSPRPLHHDELEPATQPYLRAVSYPDRFSAWCAWRVADYSSRSKDVALFRRYRQETSADLSLSEFLSAELDHHQGRLSETCASWRRVLTAVPSGEIRDVSAARLALCAPKDTGT